MAVADKNAQDVSINDIKETVSEKIDDVQEDITDFRETTEAKVDALNPTQKVLLLTGGVIVVTTLVQVVLNRFRKPTIEAENVVVVEADDTEE